MAAGYHSRRRATSPTLVVLVATLAAALVVANVSTLNVALPQISRAIGASQTELQWMVDAYAVVLAALLLPAGAIGDRVGRRLILLLGLLILAGSNAATLLVDSPELVIAARAVSGVGAALVFPATLSSITASLPEERRSRGVAAWTAAVGVGGLVGILASGILIEQYWWGSVFAFMAIASGVVLLLAAVFVPDSSDPGETNLDPVGAVLSLLAVGGLVFGIIEGPTRGWTSIESVAGIGGGAIALLAFVVWECTTRHPLLDMSLFASSRVRSGSLSIFVQFTAAFGFFFVAISYLAYVSNYGPLDTGLRLLPMGAGLLPAAALAIPLAARFGRRAIGCLGLFVLAGAFAGGLFVEVDTPYYLLAVIFAVAGAGLGFASPPATESIVEALPAAQQGVASALNDVLREFGAAIGIAIAGAAFNGAYRDAVSASPEVPDAVRDIIRESPAAALATAGDLGEAGPPLLGAVSAAVVDGWVAAMGLLAITSAVGAVGYFVLSPSPRRRHRGGQTSGSTWQWSSEPGSEPDSTVPAERSPDLDAYRQPEPSVDLTRLPPPPVPLAPVPLAPIPSDPPPSVAITPAGAPGLTPNGAASETVRLDRAEAGAVEFAAMGELGLAELTDVLDRLVAAIERLDGRSQVPDDFDCWPASHQTVVCERAAIALEEPLVTLHGLSAHARVLSRDLDPPVANALAELRRLDRPAGHLPHLTSAVAAAGAHVAAAGHGLDRLAERFDRLASLRGVLVPASTSIDGVARELTVVTEAIRSWQTLARPTAKSQDARAELALDSDSAPEPWIAITE